MPGGPEAQNGKGAQSDPNYVSRLLARSACLPGGGKIIVTPLYVPLHCFDTVGWAAGCCTTTELSCSDGAVFERFDLGMKNNQFTIRYEMLF